MPLVTTCTACYAKFVVTEEQLSAHGGDVRCGKCKSVFSALASLSSVDEKSLSKALEKDTDAIAETEFVEESSVEVKSKVTISEEVETTLEHTPQDTSLVVVPDKADEKNNDINTSINEVDSQANNIADEADTDDKSTDKTPSTILPAFSASNFNLYPPVGVATPQQEKPSIQQTYSFGDDFQTKPAKRGGVWYALLAIFFVVTAILQSVYFLRSQITAKYPQFQPLLVQACAKVGCKIELPMDIGLLAIDDSDLQEDTERKGLIRLHASLINNADYAQALPNLELTLNDADEKPVLRRNFRPQEYLEANAPISEGIQAGDEIRISLAIVPENQMVAGYRLFIGY